MHSLYDTSNNADRNGSPIPMGEDVALSSIYE